MKLLLTLALAALVGARPQDHYDSKYDDFNVDEIIANDRLLKSYTHCFIGDGKCTPDGKDISGYIPEAINTNCGKCTEKQKVLVAKTISAIKTKLPAEYEVLIKKNDPDSKYGAGLQEFIDKYSS